MKTTKIINPYETMLRNGRKLTPKAEYKGKFLKMTPELKAEIEILEKEIIYWRQELYEMNTHRDLFITSQKAQRRITFKMNDILTTILNLERKIKNLKQEHLKAQKD